MDKQNQMMKRDRLSRPELFMAVAQLYAQRSSCLRANVGAVAVRDGRIVATGYVGAPKGLPHCYEVGCELEYGHCVRTIHAEANLIAWAARVGIELLDTSIYSTHAPCRVCARLLANAGIRELTYNEEYQPSGLDLLVKLGIMVRHTSYGVFESKS